MKSSLVGQRFSFSTCFFLRYRLNKDNISLQLEGVLFPQRGSAAESAFRRRSPHTGRQNNTENLYHTLFRTLGGGSVVRLVPGRETDEGCTGVQPGGGIRAPREAAVPDPPYPEGYLPRMSTPRFGDSVIGPDSTREKELMFEERRLPGMDSHFFDGGGDFKAQHRNSHGSERDFAYSHKLPGNHRGVPSVAAGSVIRAFPRF